MITADIKTDITFQPSSSFGPLEYKRKQENVLEWTFCFGVITSVAKKGRFLDGRGNLKVNWND